jgi:serine/threonine protein kinase
MGRQVTQKSLPKQFLIDNQLNVADFKLLGAGTFGAVYSARRFDGTEVIVKISSLTRKPDIEKNDEGALISPIATTLFANELIMENEVYNKFPSFLPKPQESMIYSTGQDEEKEVFGVQIQSKVNGENLLSFMQRNDVPLSEKIQTITRTLSLIAAINSQGIEHGDYHFGNIMYDRDNKTISAID